MEPVDAGRLELLELTLAEMEEDLAAQAAELGMLRELVIRLMQMLHLNGTVKLQDLAAASEAAVAVRERGPEGVDTSMVPVMAKMLRDLASKLDAQSES
ncbi:hypothetical protein [uncultured Pseudacidovorax sp.]|uniref:hypothetical protein n=1 Tax=uncultured Pseudacidovorax sp. TaxID=679313 RepID=UPI0025CBBFA9|nr:hypothetical protein [uncultured Pseudacidovorax sp.]